MHTFKQTSKKFSKRPLAVIAIVIATFTAASCAPSPSNGPATATSDCDGSEVIITVRYTNPGPTAVNLRIIVEKHDDHEPNVQPGQTFEDEYSLFTYDTEGGSAFIEAVSTDGNATRTVHRPEWGEKTCPR